MNHCQHCGRVTAARTCPVCAPEVPQAPWRASSGVSDGTRSWPDQRRTSAARPPAPSASLSSAPIPAVWTPASSGTRLPTAEGVVASVDGMVLSQPSISATRTGPDRVARAVAVPLLVIAVVTSPGFLGALILWLIIAAVVVWLVEWLRLGRLLGIFGLLSLLRPRGARRGPWVPPTMAFRYQVDGRPREVRLVGHDTGIELGERVRVRGLPSRGTIHAVQVVNESTGATMRRHGLVRLILLVLLDASLALVIAGHLVAR